MRQADIARHIQQQAGISNNEADRLLECIISPRKIMLQKGEPILISGFAKFTGRTMRARQGRNPQTGEAVMISARRVVSFHPSGVFKSEVNSVLAER